MAKVKYDVRNVTCSLCSSVSTKLPDTIFKKIVWNIHGPENLKWTELSLYKLHTSLRSVRPKN